MSTLAMIACDACGATTEPSPWTHSAPKTWLTVDGYATEDEWQQNRGSSLNVPKRHACSAACLVIVGQRLVAAGAWTRVE